MSPLRRAQILRTLARYHAHAGDRRAAAHIVCQCLYVTAQANLVHQREALVREFSAPKPSGT